MMKSENSSIFVNDCGNGRSGVDGADSVDLRIKCFRLSASSPIYMSLLAICKGKRNYPDGSDED